jgi:hypothetical protein
MTIREVLESLLALPDEGVVFAERVDGSFLPESQAVVLELSDEELRRPVSEVARERAPGLDYFLEVFVIRDVVDDWKASAKTSTGALKRDLLGTVIHYAEYDA